MFNYPWGDFHSLNLGWFLVQFKDWVEKIQEYLDNGGGTSENLANVIAPVFNAANSYLTGDYVLYNDELYKANQAVNPGTWNPDAWTRCLVTEEMGSGAGGVDNVARLMIAGQYSNTYNYQKYAICRYNDKLWMCNTNLPAGGEEWEPSHWDEITVGAGLTGLRRSAETLSNAITDLQNIVGDGALSGFTATNLTGAANELKGSLTNRFPLIITSINELITAGQAAGDGNVFDVVFRSTFTQLVTNMIFNATSFGQAVYIAGATPRIDFNMSIPLIGASYSGNLGINNQTFTVTSLKRNNNLISSTSVWSGNILTFKTEAINRALYHFVALRSGATPILFEEAYIILRADSLVLKNVEGSATYNWDYSTGTLTITLPSSDYWTYNLELLTYV